MLNNYKTLLHTYNTGTTNNTTEHLLSNGMFSTCSVVWDKNINKFRSATLYETVVCVNNNCLDLSKECYKYCNNNNECYIKCDNMKEQCARIRRLVKGADEHGIYYNCSKDINCVRDDGWIIPSCLKKNEKKVKECCYKNCIDPNIGCNEYCEKGFDFLIKNDYTKNKTKFDSIIMKPPLLRKRNNYLIIIIVLIILLLIFVIVK